MHIQHTECICMNETETEKEKEKENASIESRQLTLLISQQDVKQNNLKTITYGPGFDFQFRVGRTYVRREKLAP